MQWFFTPLNICSNSLNFLFLSLCIALQQSLYSLNNAGTAGSLIWTLVFRLELVRSNRNWVSGSLLTFSIWNCIVYCVLYIVYLYICIFCKYVVYTSWHDCLSRGTLMEKKNCIQIKHKNSLTPVYVIFHKDPPLRRNLNFSNFFCLPFFVVWT